MVTRFDLKGRRDAKGPHTNPQDSPSKKHALGESENCKKKKWSEESFKSPAKIF